MHILKTCIKISGTGLFTALLAQPALAQFASNSSAPISITADDVEYQGAQSILRGGVDVRQGDVRVLADEMIVFSGKNGLGGGDIKSIKAVGNFYYITPAQSVRGQSGIYTRENDTFVVTGDVVMKQEDGNIITGEKLYYNLKSQNARVVGTCKGRKCGAKGRVNILIQNTDTVNNRNS